MASLVGVHEEGEVEVSLGKRQLPIAVYDNKIVSQTHTHINLEIILTHPGSNPWHMIMGVTILSGIKLRFFFFGI